MMQHPPAGRPSPPRTPEETPSAETLVRSIGGLAARLSELIDKETIWRMPMPGAGHSSRRCVPISPGSHPISPRLSASS